MKSKYNYSKIVKAGKPVKKSSPHNWGVDCPCDKGVRYANYRDVIVVYDSDKYHFYHQTAVLVVKNDKYYELNDGGYKTKSTKERMNNALPTGYKVFQDDYNWYVETPSGVLDYESGMIIEAI